MSCRCDKVSLLVEGERLIGITRHDPDCTQHGRGHEWTLTDPMRKYAKRGPNGELLETPREVEARLIQEARG